MSSIIPAICRARFGESPICRAVSSRDGTGAVIRTLRGMLQGTWAREPVSIRRRPVLSPADCSTAQMHSCDRRGRGVSIGQHCAGYSTTTPTIEPVLKPMVRVA